MGSSCLESRPGPVLRDRRSNAEVDRRPALDCREHPPTGSTRGVRTAAVEGRPLDGSECATGRPTEGRAKLIFGLIGREVRGTWGPTERHGWRLQAEHIRPPLGTDELGIEQLHRTATTAEQSHRIPHDVAVPICATKKNAAGERTARQTGWSGENMPSHSIREA